MAVSVGTALLVSAAATVASTVVQQQAAGKAAKQAAAAARERKEAAAIEQAGGRNIDRFNRRKALRQERVRRAQIIQGAVGSGVGGSSGALAAPGIVGTGTAAAISQQAAGRGAIEGVAAHRQAGADLTQAARTTLARGSLLAKTIGAAGSVGSGLISAGLFDPSPNVGPTPGEIGYGTPF